LSRAYKPSSLYVNSFVSKFLIIVAKFILIAFGAIFAVLIVLTVIDEDVLNVEHVLTIISISGAIAGVARSLIPDDEQAIYFVEQIMFQILAQLHYMPDGWKDHPQSLVTRSEFVKVFQFKFVSSL
jgi:autophagy-related protein 9